MTERKGEIKVQTTDILPIIKKWLYSEHDIFIRELVANATDAITKRQTLARTINQETPEASITVRVNKDQKTITIQDNGIGMSEDEVEKYIAQLAFSGAEEFVQKMQDSGDQPEQEIIGKFGLGFYSAFMVADKVEVNSLSMNEGAKATKWTCAGDTEYVFSDSDKTEVGTEITLHINAESEEFLNAWKMQETLRNFCDFMPVPIGVLDECKEIEYPKNEEGEEDKTQAPLPNDPTIINNLEPLWKKDPKECTEEEYKNFYRRLFPMDQEPLFWVHLKIDHPFTLEGILYFPKIDLTKPQTERNIKLYSKQVFVSDNVKNIIPDFLSLLKGVIDSSDIPLNVSRSSLQGDPNIKRISNYVVKKVADALKKLARKEREQFEQIWPDTGLFVKYGCVSEPKFDEIMRDYVVFKTGSEKFKTLVEYQDALDEKAKEKLADKVLYFEKGKVNQAILKEAIDAGFDAIETDDHIDPHFMQHVETQKKGDKTFAFTSLDSEFENLLETESADENDMKIKDLFVKYIAPVKEGEEKDPSSMEVELKKMSSNTATPAYIKIDEQMKRFAQMTKSMGQNAMFPVKKTLVINPANPLIKNMLKIHESGNQEQLVEKICHHVGDLAKVSSQGLEPEEREVFVQRSQDLIQELTGMTLS